MIRALFNNRWFVITLAVASGLFMLHSVAAPFLDQPDFADAEDPEFYLDDLAPTEEETETVRLPSGQSVLSGELNWTNTPGRDPFSPGARLSDSGSRILHLAHAPGSTRLPRLHGLVAGPDSLLAVLDDRIVREGDTIGPFLVKHIERGGVRLTSSYADHWLPVTAMKTATSSVAANRSEQEISHGGDPGF